MECSASLAFEFRGALGCRFLAVCCDGQQWRLSTSAEPRVAQAGNLESDLNVRRQAFFFSVNNNCFPGAFGIILPYKLMIVTVLSGSRSEPSVRARTLDRSSLDQYARNQRDSLGSCPHRRPIRTLAVSWPAPSASSKCSAALNPLGECSSVSAAKYPWHMNHR